MSTKLGFGPYLNEDAVDDDDTGAGSPVIETTLTATIQSVNIGGTSVNAEVFNGNIPGPTFRLQVGDSVAVRLVNDLPYEIGIHWHGVELENYSDGTEVTQNGAAPAPVQTLGNGTPAGGTFLYKFKVTRPGIFWYHPHHKNSINRVFRGLYGMIIVTDPLEAGLVGGVLPAAADTVDLVLSDITVCKVAGSNLNAQGQDETYDDPTALPAADRPEWLSGLTSQSAPSPKDLCELPGAKDDDGAVAAASYAAGDVPSIMAAAGVRVQGQTVLTNGVNVGVRKGTPAAPNAALEPGAVSRNVQPGQGLRFQMLNCSHFRYFRLRLTTAAGAQVNLLRVGGEGGLLDNAILEGGTIGTGFNTGYDSGEIVLAPAVRADVVAAIPSGLPVNSVLTLWTRDYEHIGTGTGQNKWAGVPTVPVAHFTVAGAAAAYTLAAGAAIRAPAMPPVDTLGAATGNTLPVPAGKKGLQNDTINVQTGGSPSIDGKDASAIMMATDFMTTLHIDSTRYAENGKILELTVTNSSLAHHPFHLHGFSFQPVKMVPIGAGTGTIDPWPYKEFRDTIDLFPDHAFTFRVRLDDRKLADGVTDGGAFGRWLFHCHIFFHHERGMVSELVVTDNIGREKPNISVGGSWAYAPIPGVATRQGRFHHTDGLAITLTASKGTVVANVPNPGEWSWSYTSAPGDPPSNEYVYITATDTLGRQDQAVFRLQVGGTDDASDQGDPHLRTVDGTRYDFQAAGEFILLRDRDGMEVQVRQTPAVTPPPVKDDYSGLTVCVSLNSAAAARVGSHRISYQPGRERDRLSFFLDGKLMDPPRAGMDLDAHRVTTFDAGGQIGIRIDYAHGAVVKITPNFWTSYGIHYLDVDVSNTNADEGLMGRIPPGTWLPKLSSGATVGPLPVSLHGRYVALYKTFADSWRLTDATSMFVYFPGRPGTAYFTDRNWPPQKPPCTTLQPGFPLPVHPIKENISIARAKQICKDVKLTDLHAFCVFDVATTGDETFAKNYLIAQELRLRGTAVQIVGNKPRTRPGEPLRVTATVLPRTPAKKAPTGTVTFIVDSVPVRPPKKLDECGRAHLTVATLKPGEHKIRADYTPAGEKYQYHPSSSPNLLHTVSRRGYTVTKPPGGMMPMGEASAHGQGSDAGPPHTAAKGKKAPRRTGRAHKKNR